MNTLNTILKKITPVKTDLASKKVDLGIMQDLQSEVNKGQSLIKEGQDRIEQARDTVNKAYNIVEDQLGDIIVRADNIANNLKGAFKDLDSPLSSKAEKAIKELDNLEKLQRKLISDIKNVT